MMHPLSLEAWAEVSKDLKKSQKRVFEVIANSDYSMTCEEVAISLNTFPNCISGRFGELSEMGFIIPDKTVGRTRSGHKATKWKVATDKKFDQMVAFERLDEANQIAIDFV